jgi:hypothetical protein
MIHAVFTHGLTIFAVRGQCRPKSHPSWNNAIMAMMIIMASPGVMFMVTPA